MSIARILDRTFISPLGAVLYCAAIWSLVFVAAWWVLS